MAVFYEVAPV